MTPGWIIDMHCASCRRAYRGRGHWALTIVANKLVGAVCPRCQEPNGGSTSFPSHAAQHLNGLRSEWIHASHVEQPGVHLIHRSGDGAILILDHAELSTHEQAVELGQTLLLLGQLLGSANGRTAQQPEKGAGPNGT